MVVFLFEEGDKSEFFSQLQDDKALYWEGITAGDGGYLEDYWTYVGSETWDDCEPNILWAISTEI
jgi:hypothetical protein